MIVESQSRDEAARVRAIQAELERCVALGVDWITTKSAAETAADLTVRSEDDAKSAVLSWFVEVTPHFPPLEAAQPAPDALVGNFEALNRAHGIELDVSRELPNTRDPRATAARVAATANRQLRKLKEPRRWRALLVGADSRLDQVRWFLLDERQLAALRRAGLARSFVDAMGGSVKTIPFSLAAMTAIAVAAWKPNTFTISLAAVLYIAWFLARRFTARDVGQRR